MAKLDRKRRRRARQAARRRSAIKRLWDHQIRLVAAELGLDPAALAHHAATLETVRDRGGHRELRRAV